LNVQRDQQDLICSLLTFSCEATLKKEFSRRFNATEELKACMRDGIRGISQEMQKVKESFVTRLQQCV
jgi:hypothetical protein